MANRINEKFDVAVVGSGAGGGVVAHRLTEMGRRVILIEAGHYFRTEDFNTDFWWAMKNMFWENGLQYGVGDSMIPFLHGKLVGGTTTINSAISWDLPEDVHREWMENDRFGISYDEINSEQQRIRRDLHIVPVDPSVAGGNNNAMKRGAERLGWKGRVIERNESGCKGSARCPVGCPNGAKMSLEKTYIPWAMGKGMTLLSDSEVLKVLVDNGEAKGILVKRKGGNFVVHADRVVVSAGTIYSPIILQKSNVPDPYRLIGSHLMAHPGISVIGLFDEKIDLWKGAAQGYEVTEFRKQGVKVETLAVSPSLFAFRLPATGMKLAELYERRAHMAMFCTPIRAKTIGSVRKGRPISPIRYRFVDEDVEKLLFATRITGELLFAAGAREVFPGIAGRPDSVQSVEELYQATRGPVSIKDFHPAATHHFGTCRISPDPTRGVVGDDFECHTVKNLYVADASIFPTNMGVNPQLSIMALAAVAAKRIAV